MKAVGLTGASGYVGSNLASRFERDGWNVVRLGFRLGDEVRSEELQNLDALVHCAYDFRPVAWRDIHRTNVEGSRKLLERVRAGGVRKIVVLSTISAFAGCRSLYGRAKLEIEAAAESVRAAVLRPGLVYVDADSLAGGMYGSLMRSARGSLAPLIDSGRHCQYLIHIDDLYALVSKLASGDLPVPRRPIVAAAPRCWTMRDLVTELGRRQDRRPRLIGVPWRAVWLGLKAAELAHLPLGYRSDSVVSLVHQDPHPDFSALRELGVTVRDFGAA